MRVTLNALSGVDVACVVGKTMSPPKHISTSATSVDNNYSYMYCAIKRTTSHFLQLTPWQHAVHDKVVL